MRITAGRFKNKRVDVLKGASMIRPTTDKMRQAIFNMLEHASWGMSLDGITMLDGYCGSGIMGMEALSRGASHVIFADQNRKALDHIKNTLMHDLICDRAQYTIAQGDLTRRATFHEKIDFVFMDPPYRQDFVRQSLIRMAEDKPLTDGALILCETEKEASFTGAPAVFTVEDERLYGDSKLVALRYHATIE